MQEVISMAVFLHFHAPEGPSLSHLVPYQKCPLSSVESGHGGQYGCMHASLTNGGPYHYADTHLLL